MKLKKVTTVIVVLAASGLLGYKIYDKIQASKNIKQKGAAFAVAIEIVPMERKDIRDLRLFTGSLEPWANYNVAPKVGGYWVKSGNIKMGEPLPLNGFIGKIDDTEYQQAFQQAQANYDVTLAQLAEAQATLELRRREFQRQQELEKITSKAQLETAEYTMKSQEASVQVKAAELKRQAAALEIAQIQLNDTVISNLITDPQSRAFVAEKLVNIGDLVSPNQVILKVVDIGRLNAKISVIEKDYPYLKVGQLAEISTDAYPNKIFYGKIKHIAQNLQSKSRQAEVEVQIDNESLELKPGMYVRVFLEFAKHDNAQVVPRNAIVKQHDKEGIFLLDAPNEQALFVPVQTGIVLDDKVEILKPTNIRQPIITLGNHLLVHNSKVLIPKFSKEQPTSIDSNTVEDQK